MSLLFPLRGAGEEVCWRRGSPASSWDGVGSVSGDDGGCCPPFFRGAGYGLGDGIRFFRALVRNRSFGNFSPAREAGSGYKAEEEGQRRRATVSFWTSMMTGSRGVVL